VIKKRDIMGQGKKEAERCHCGHEPHRIAPAIIRGG
jgi:hypothetical protein